MLRPKLFSLSNGPERVEKDFNEWAEPLKEVWQRTAAANFNHRLLTCTLTT